jgi:hypothetical protein
MVVHEEGPKRLEVVQLTGLLGLAKLRVKNPDKNL